MLKMLQWILASLILLFPLLFMMQDNQSIVAKGPVASRISLPLSFSPLKPQTSWCQDNFSCLKVHPCRKYPPCKKGQQGGPTIPSLLSFLPLPPPPTSLLMWKGQHHRVLSRSRRKAGGGEGGGRGGAMLRQTHAVYTAEETKLCLQLVSRDIYSFRC